MSDEAWLRDMLTRLQEGQTDIRERLASLDVLIHQQDKRGADHSQRLAAIEQQRDRAIGFLLALAAGGGTVGAMVGSLLHAIGVMP